MNNIEFQEKEFIFIEHLKNSSIYKQLKDLSKQIDNDEFLTALASSRDEYLQKADLTTDKEEKKQLLIKFNEKDKELNNQPLIQEYLTAYSQVNQILRYLADKLTEEINLW